jgi:hypothetical protein
MHQWAKQQQAVWEKSQQMCPVFLPEKKRSDGEKPKQHPPASRTKPGTLFGTHAFLHFLSAKILLLGIELIFIDLSADIPQPRR